MSWDEVAGNAEAVESLRVLTAQGAPPHAYLLTGPSGCGKTTIGRIIALSLGLRLEDVVPDGTGDYRELDNAHFRGIETIRDIREGASYVGLHGARRVWLLDEVHGLGKLQQDALLKGLEDPPPHAYFVLCTTVPDQLQETIRSRCSIHRVAPLDEPDMIRLLHRVASGEGHRLSRPLLRAVWERTEGKPRAAITLLEKVIAADPAARDAIVAAHEAVREKADGLARALMGRNGWKAVAAVLATMGEDDVEPARRGILGYCDKALLNGDNSTAAQIMDLMVEPFYQSGKPGFDLACYTIVKEREREGMMVSAALRKNPI